MRLSNDQLAVFLAQHDPIWEATPVEWDHGIPLGNGHIGAMIWGDGAPLKITLDKYDCWELREQYPDPAIYNWAHLRELVLARDDKRAREEFRDRMREQGGVFPTRLPMPRLELDLGGRECWPARLRLFEAFVEAPSWRAYVHATRNVLVVELDEPAQVRLRTDHLDEKARETLARWGYDEPERGEAGDVRWLRQRLPAGGEYAVAWRQVGVDDGRSVVLVSLATHNDVDVPLAEALRLVTATAQAGTGSDLFTVNDDTHAAWWAGHWRRSFLTMPDTHLEALYCIETYKLGCSSRPGGLPISLQGVWTVDGQMPPWSGDYHLDSNLQQSYWPVYAGNRLELGEPLYETFSKCLPRWRRQCRGFFGFDGIWSGCALGPGGEQVYGYHGAGFWPGNAAWLAHNYWLHWLYSRDREFLHQQALPLMRGCLQTWQGLLEEGQDGRLHMPLGYSPEWGEGSTERYGPDPTCDLQLIRWLAQSLLEATETLGIQDPDAEGWRDLLDRLADYPQGEDGLHVLAGHPLIHSHRHHSHLMAVHPLGNLNLDGTAEERDLIQRSINHWLITGMGQWAGHGMGPSSLIAARVGRGNMAWLHCDLYARCFITPATLHTNGDYRRFGLTRFTNRPMTIEAGFAIAAALIEMVLQSWGGTIRLFPAIPDHWHDLCFEDLRAEGAFLVSSRLRDRQVTHVRIVSEAGGTCRLLNPWPAEAVTVSGSRGDLRLERERVEWETVAGDEYLVFAEGREPDERDLTPDFRERPGAERHWFGLKRRARF